MEMPHGVCVPMLTISKANDVAEEDEEEEEEAAISYHLESSLSFFSRDSSFNTISCPCMRD